MPRIARSDSPGTFRQVICVFTNHEFRLVDDRCRAAYLRLMGRYFELSDWQLVCYALMSSHIHIGAIGGRMQLSRIFQPLNSTIARWLNLVQERRGPVFAGRPDEYLYEPELVPAVIAYIHNNPVKAGRAVHAAESTWTSHRAYLGLEEAPPWLHMDAGFAACGLRPTQHGRAAFDELVRSSVNDEPIEGTLADRASHRAALRAELDCPVELSAPTYSAARRARWDLLAPAELPIRRRWDGDLRDVLLRVQLATGISAEAMHSRSRTAATVSARRIYLLAASQYLGRPLTEAAGILGKSVQAASKLIRADAAYQPELRRVAVRIARESWESDTRAARKLRKATSSPTEA